MSKSVRIAAVLIAVLVVLGGLRFVAEARDDKKPSPHPGAEMIKSMAKLIGKPVRAADDVNNAAGFEGWRGQVYEASPSGSVRSVAVL